MSNDKPKRKIELQEVDFRGDHRGVFTWTEIVNGKINDVSKEILGAGTRLKEKLGTTISTVVIGDKVEQYAQELIAYGADRVILIEHPALKDYVTRAYAEAIIQVIQKFKPEIFLFGATTTGRDLAPRIAARLEVGLSADCTEFSIGDYKNMVKKQQFKNVAHFIRPSYGESKLATIIGPWTFPQMATARPGAMLPLDPDPNRSGEILKFEVNIPESELAVKILESTVAEGSDDKAAADLVQAHIIVSGGYGVGKDGFDVLQQLVDALNSTGHKAALGASRKAVESGFISRSHQVGQTGRTVRPHWYIAIGISGAIQHIAGMKHSKKVIAINKDPDAPIFQHADFGIVARFEDAVPELIKSVKSGFTFPALTGN